MQKAYRGWWQLGYVLAIQLASMVAVIVMSRQQPRVFWPALFAVLCLAAAQIVFWTYTFPANVATENWVKVPANWEALRRQWEYSHAAGAVCQMLAMSSLIIAVLTRARDSAAERPIVLLGAAPSGPAAGRPSVNTGSDRTSGQG